MFSYHIPGGINTVSYINVEGQIKFDPPVYEQRYMTTVRILEDPRWAKYLKKVVDYGCAEMRLLTLLRRIAHLTCILEVDIDETLLQANQSRAVPLVSDYLQKRENPLHVEILNGSIDASVENLKNTDAVIALEIIEHLHANVLEKVPENIFGFIQPKLAIFSTPNSEFNVLFEPLLENGFRHLDHKFEWNRSEFKKWALGICKRYPNYRVAFLGLGKPPPDHKNLGYSTQLAVFARKDILNESLAEAITAQNIPANNNPEVQYKEVYAVDFPFYSDERSKEQKIIDEARYYIDRCRRVERFFNRERCIFQIPFKELIAYANSVGGTESELLTILKQQNIKVEDDFILMPEYDEDNESFRHYDDCYDDVNSDWFNSTPQLQNNFGEEAEGVEQINNLVSDITLNKNPNTIDDDSEENWD